MTIELFLPIPVTLNKLTHNNKAKNGGKGGRSKSKRAKDWYREAQYAVAPFVHDNAALCNKNILTRNRYYNFGKKAIDLQHLVEDHQDLSYCVNYFYYFAEQRHKLPRDIFNYEKQLTDFLADIGFLLDDAFIDDGRVKRMPCDPKNPRVEIEIILLDPFIE